MPYLWVFYVMCVVVIHSKPVFVREMYFRYYHDINLVSIQEVLYFVLSWLKPFAFQKQILTVFMYYLPIIA